MVATGTISYYCQPDSGRWWSMVVDDGMHDSVDDEDDEDGQDDEKSRNGGMLNIKA